MNVLRAALAVLFLLLVATRLPANDVFGPRGDGSDYALHAEPADALYKSPIQLLLTPDGRTLFATCEGSHEVLIVDTRKSRVVGSIPTDELPFGLALSPDGRTLYVGNRGDYSVSVVDVESRREVARYAVGEDPHALVLDREGRRLFVANLGTNDLSVLDTETGREIKRLPMGVAPFDAALSPDGRTLFVSNQRSNPVPFRTPPIPELTVVDVPSATVRERRPLHSTVVAQGVAVSPDGRFTVTVAEVTKNLIPQTQIYQGWMVTYGLAITETREEGRTAFLLLDEPNLYYGDPYGVAFSPDGAFLYVSSSAANTVSVIDVERAFTLLRVEDGRIGIDDATIRRYARHLGLSGEYVAARIPTGYNPKDLVVSRDGRTVYVADRLDDRITVIDAERQSVRGTIELGGPDEMTTLRHGARLFNFASISFQRQLSCATCHPEEHVDGLIYDIAADGGMGRNLVDNRSLRGIAHTDPYKWSGKNPNLDRQEGPRAAQLFFRTHGFEGAERNAIVRFIQSNRLRPNRYGREGQPLNEFQQLGKEMYERDYDNLGRYIPTANRCITCHPPPYGTDKKRHDVGSKAEHDRNELYDSCNLTNMYLEPPYMHDGRCYSLEEIWTLFNPGDTHGVTNDMTKDQLNALIEYVKTL